MPMNILYMVQNSNIETPTMEVLGLQFDILALQYKTNMRTPLPYQQHIPPFFYNLLTQAGTSMVWMLHI